jgi:hypothetical protein
VRKFNQGLSAHYDDSVLPQQSVYELNAIYAGRTGVNDVERSGRASTSTARTRAAASCRSHHEVLHLLDFQPTKIESLHPACLWSCVASGAAI